MLRLTSFVWGFGFLVIGLVFLVVFVFFFPREAILFMPCFYTVWKLGECARAVAVYGSELACLY